MRIGLIVAGVLIAAIGIAGVTGALHFRQEHEVLKVGDFSAKTEETRGVPQWLGIAGVVVGGVLILGGALRKA